MIVEPVSNYLKTNEVLYREIMALVPGTMIAGGAARQIFLHEEFGSTDIDIYCPDMATRALLIRRLQAFRRKVSSKAHTFHVDTSVKKIELQIIKSIYTLPQNIFMDFDLTCCCFAIKDDRIYYTKEAKEHSINKRMFFQHQEPGQHLYPYLRFRKYLEKGFIPTCDLSLDIFKDFLLWYVENEKCRESDNGDDFLFYAKFEKDTPISEIYDAFFGSTSELEY